MRRNVDKNGFQTKFFFDFLANQIYTDNFCFIVTTSDYVYTIFLCRMKIFMVKFTGQICVETF